MCISLKKLYITLISAMKQCYQLSGKRKLAPVKSLKADETSAFNRKLFDEFVTANALRAIPFRPFWGNCTKFAFISY